MHPSISIVHSPHCGRIHRVGSVVMAMLPHFQKTTFKLPEKQTGQAVPFSLISMKRFLMSPNRCRSIAVCGKLFYPVFARIEHRVYIYLSVNGDAVSVLFTPFEGSIYLQVLMRTWEGG